MFMNTGKDIFLYMNTGNSVQGIDGYLYFYGTICQEKGLYMGIGHMASKKGSICL